MEKKLINVLDVLGVDNSVASIVASLFQRGDYQEALMMMVSRYEFITEEWQEVALTHRLVVAYQPSAAHHWLKCVLDYICASVNHVSLGFYQGSILGLLQAGAWLNGHPPTMFQNHLLSYLANMMCHCVSDESKHKGMFPKDFNYGKLGKELRKALEKFLLIKETMPGEKAQQRVQWVREALVYIEKHFDKQNPEYVTRLLIDGMVQYLVQKADYRKKAAIVDML